VIEKGARKRESERKGELVRKEDKRERREHKTRGWGLGCTYDPECRQLMVIKLCNVHNALQNTTRTHIHEPHLFAFGTLSRSVCEIVVGKTTYTRQQAGENMCSYSYTYEMYRPIVVILQGVFQCKYRDTSL